MHEGLARQSAITTNLHLSLAYSSTCVSQRTNTFAWASVGFDGPVLPRDLTFDVLDHNQANGDVVNLGWQVPADGTSVALTTLPMDHLSAATAGLLTYNFYSYDTITMVYRLNGGIWHSVPWPYPDTTTFSWRTLAVPIVLSELQAGPNTIEFMASASAVIADVDLVLPGTGGTIAP